MSRDYYAVIGLRQNASDATIRRALQVNKDLIAADPSLSPVERESRLSELQAAADVLSSPAKRDAYDATMRQQFDTAGRSGAAKLMRAPLTWMILLASIAIGGGLYWQYERDQTNRRIERERIVADQQQERRAAELEERRVVEKQRLLEELRTQRDADDKQRQEFNELRSAESQKKQYVADERQTLPTASSFQSNYETSRRNYEDQRQIGSEVWQRAQEERKQRFEDEMNLRRAREEVARQKRYLEDREREDQNARARREADSRPNRY